MRILVFNAGSSSLSYKIFDLKADRKSRVVFRGKAYRVGVKGLEPSYVEDHFKGRTTRRIVPIPDHVAAASLAVGAIKKNALKVDAVGHRFVHGGEYFKRSVLLDRDSLDKLERCLPLAPLHNPISMSVIKESGRLFPDVPQYAVIDSAFHSSIAPRAYTYSLPRNIVKRYQYRRYGFHGISYSYICRQVPEFLKRNPKTLNMIVCHLGTGGGSVVAVRAGRSMDTSMGFSPNSGLMMSTRSGDIDPMIIPGLMRTSGYSAQAVEDLLNKKSGLLGISGFSSDITDIMARRDKGRFQKRARLAFEMYVHRIKRYIGSYIVALDGQLDALVFTDDIGVGNPVVREHVCDSLRWAGIGIDRKKNRQGPNDRPALIQSSSSSVSIISMPTEEELMICLEGGRLLGGQA